ncbi:MAG: GAF domain-containing protein, partial [Cyanobacteriota bacterium]
MTNLSHTNLVNNNSDMTIEEFTPDTQELETSESIHSAHPSFDPLGSTNKSNGDGTATGLIANGDNPNQALALVTAIKADLEQAGELAQPETQEKILQLEKWVQSLQNGGKRLPNVTTEQYFKQQRQWLLNLTTQMRRAGNLETLFNTTVNEVRQYLQVDRVLIYQFQTENQGMVVAESMVAGYTPSLGESLPAIAFGAGERLEYQQQQVVALEHIYQKTRSPYQLQLMQKYQVKASISLPILLQGSLWGFQGKVWGLLVLQHCSGVSRRWQEAEINLLYQVASEVSLNLQPEELRAQKQKLVAQDKAAGKVVAQVLKKILHSLDVESVFTSATKELRQQLNCDRVAVYRFNSDWSGEFVAESVGPDWTPLVGPDIKKVWVDTYLKDTQGGRYRQEETLTVDNIYTAGMNSCHIDLLEQFEAKAFVLAPILEGEKLWGLLAAYQNSGPRHWEEAEISMLAIVGRQFGVALQQAAYLESLQARSGQLAKAAERERAVAKVIEKIRQNSDIEKIFQTTTLEVRKLFNIERVTVYKFRDDYFGDFVTESESGGWPKLVGSGWEDPYLQEHQGGRFRNNEALVVDNVYNGGLTECHVEALEYFGVKSCMVVAIFQGKKLWGLLSAFQHSGVRHWEDNEVKVLSQIANQLGVALQQAEYLEQLREQSNQLARTAELERAATRIVANIRQSVDLETIFKTTSREIRQMLNTDRVGVFRFHADSDFNDGEFVSEDVLPNYPSAMDVKIHDHCFGEKHAQYYRVGRVWAVTDIYQEGLAECHLAILAPFQVRAYLVVPLLKRRE